MSKNVEVLSHEAIVYLCGLIKNLTKVSEAIDDTNLASNKVFSNLYTKTIVDKCLDDAKDYADEVINAVTHLVAEKIDFEPTLDNTTDKINTILLYSANSDNNYTQYLRLTNELVNLGDTTISLDGYLTIVKASQEYCTKTEYNALNDKVTNIETTIGDSAQLEDDISNEIVALKGKSALKTLTQAQYTELVTNGSVVVAGETITYSDDDYYVISDDSDNVNLDKFNLKTYTLPSQLGLTNDCTIDNIIQVLPVKSSYLGDSATMTNKSQFPTATSDYTFIINKSTTSRYSVIATDKETGKMYTGKVSADSPFTFNGWTKVCTANVEDVELTYMNYDNTANYESNVNGAHYHYTVVNGICFVEVDVKCITSATTNWSYINSTTSTRTPIRKDGKPTYFVLGGSDGSVVTGICDNVGRIGLMYGNSGIRYVGSFSFPVNK